MSGRKNKRYSVSAREKKKKDGTRKVTQRASTTEKEPRSCRETARLLRSISTGGA